MNPQLRTFDAASVNVPLAPTTTTPLVLPTYVDTNSNYTLPLSPLVAQVEQKDGEVLTEQQKSDEQKKKVYMYVGFGVGALALIFVLYKIFKK